MYRQKDSGSALIMVILLIVLMVSMAVGFMSMVGRQRGSALVKAAQTKADIALQQAQMHAIKCMGESVADTSVAYTTTYNPSWRTEFAAVTDPDGNPYTDDGESKRAGAKYSTTASTWMVSGDALTNSSANLLDMIGYGVGRNYANMFGFGMDMDKWGGSSYRYISRWHNVEFLDAHFRHIEIDDALSEADKADLREGARYVVRYIAQVFDLNGMQTINNNYPNGPIAPGTGAGGVDDVEYIRYQNYLRCYGRSLKSQISCYLSSSSFGMQRRSNDPDAMTGDPLDLEVCNISVRGDLAKTPYSSLGFTLETDARLRAERAFRGDLQWAGQTRVYSNRYDMLAPLHKSRVYSWGHISQVFIGEGIRYPIDSHAEVYGLTPYSEAVNTFTRPEAAPSPWHVNLLTSPNNVLARMIMGLSSQLHYSRNKNPINGMGDRAAQADLFGVDYPEAFTLGLDAGRDVPLVGEGDVNAAGNRVVLENKQSFNGFPAFYRGGEAVFTSGIAGQQGIQASPGYENSYFFDIAMALNLAIRNVRRAWIEDKELTLGAEYSYPATSPRVFMFKNGVNNSYIDRGESDPKIMLQLVLRECYRILGEGYIDTSYTPAKSKNFYDRSADPANKNDRYKMGLLAGGVNNVGLGSLGFCERQAQLPATANTRAMEYALNDVMISLFGKANPAFTAADPRRPSASADAIDENIAVDFNNDGYAESTVSGWYDPTRKERVWSFWWDGLGPYVSVDYDYMRDPAWYRLYEDGSIKRKNGSQWVDLTAAEVVLFNQYNSMWLTGNARYPIKPHAKTGRFFIGKSKLLQGCIRGEVFNITDAKRVAHSNRTFVYHVDPNNDDDFSDSHVLQQADFSMK